MYPYLGVGYPFNACVNASAYTGVKFNISGTLTTGCTIQFSVVDKQHSTVANNGTCTEANCYASAKIFPLPATATDVTVLFSEQTGGGAAVGAAAGRPDGAPQHPVADQPGGRRGPRGLHRHGHHRQRHVHLVATAPLRRSTKGLVGNCAGRAFCLSGGRRQVA